MTETEIQAIQDLAKARLLTILADPKPSYSVGEHSVSWTEYHDMLMRTIKDCETLMTNLPTEEMTLWRGA